MDQSGLCKENIDLVMACGCLRMLAGLFLFILYKIFGELCQFLIDKWPLTEYAIHIPIKYF